MLRPGETQTKTFELKPGVRCLGVVVLFRDIDHAQWRATAPIARERTDRSSVAAPLSRDRARAGGIRMTWTNRVVWLEGMFLRAQHFQQQDRWLGAAGARRAPRRCARIPGA